MIEEVVQKSAVGRSIVENGHDSQSMSVLFYSKPRQHSSVQEGRSFKGPCLGKKKKKKNSYINKMTSVCAMSHKGALLPYAKDNNPASVARIYFSHQNKVGIRPGCQFRGNRIDLKVIHPARASFSRNLQPLARHCILYSAS